MLEGTRLRSTRFIKNAAAAIALQKAFSPLDRDQGNEKQTDIVVQPLEAGRRQAATGADPRLFIHFYSSGLNSTDKDEGSSPPIQLDPSIKQETMCQPHYITFWDRLSISTHALIF